METYEVTSSDVRNNLMKLGQIVFEVTTACNFRCEYCIYSGMYEGMQTLSDDYLTFDKARKILDYLSDIWTTGKRINKKPIYIGFYGGEPLMNFPLVKQVVEYIERNWKWRVIFTMTTNAYLLDKYMEFLQQKDFFLTISLDGDQECNKLRKTKSGRETYSKVFANIMRLKEYNEDYFSRRVNFNAVFNANSSYNSIYNFFIGQFNKIPKVSQMYDAKRDKSKEELFESIYSNKNKQHFILSLKKQVDPKYFHFLPGVQESCRVIDKQSGNMFHSYNDLLVNEKNKKLTPTGTCAPFAKKMFITAKGEILQCEKISHAYVLGHINKDEVFLDIEEIAKFYNNQILSYASQCVKCGLRNMCPHCFFHDYPVPSEMNQDCSHYTTIQEQDNLFKRCLNFLKDTPQLYDRFIKEITYY